MQESASVDPSPSVQDMLPLRMISRVVRGYGRGSSDLGIPTANLSPDDTRCGGGTPTEHAGNPKNGFDHLPTGIYWGFCRVFSEDDDNGSNNSVVYTTACSIGYNPTYGNKKKTVEPHLIAPSENDPRRHASSCGESVLGEFYGSSIRLSLVGYLRPELPFEGIEKLIAAIKQDIANTEKLAKGDDPLINKERSWTASTDGVE